MAEGTWVPGYVGLFKTGELARRIEAGLGMMESCRLCPRRCGVNRLAGETGYCRTGRTARVASYNAHFGEEAPLVGRRGSGTIFVSSCNLLCSFCQNAEISHGNEGVDVTPRQMASMMLDLAAMGCHNINIVTPTHVVPMLLEALAAAVPQGLSLPLVYNCGGYESVETLRLIEGVVDIYMPDFKFWDPQWAERFCQADDYPECAREALHEMHRQVGDLVLDETGIARKGLLVRHLVMPNNVAGTAEIMRFLAREISPDTYVNVMDQYRPCWEARKDPLIDRRLTAAEFSAALDAAHAAGLHRLDRRERPRIFFGL